MLRAVGRKALIECLRCTERFSLNDIVAGRFWIETLICSGCYAKMQAAPYRESCFGKPTVILDNGTKRYGYDKTSKACGEWCPDRKICARIINHHE